MSVNYYPKEISSSLLAEIYGAAISQNLWPTILDQCATYVGSKGSALLSFDTQDPTAYSISALSEIFRDIDDSLLEHYLKHIAPMDAPGHHYSLTIPSKQAFRDTDIWPDSELLDQREDTAWFVKHFGVRRRIGMRLNDNPRYFENLAFQLPATYDEAPDIALANMEALAPHIAKSLEMNTLYHTLQRHYSAVLSVLDCVGIGMCIVERSGSLITKNTESQRILDEGYGLYLSSTGHLNCSNSDDTAKLNSMIQSASLNQTDHAPRAESIMTLREFDKNEPLIIEVSPLRDHNDELNTGFNAVLIQLVDVNSSQHCDVSAFSIAYQLTSAESAIVPLILEGLTNREIAEQRGTSLDTVKTQITALMRKSNVNSRVQLIRRILKTEPPVVVPT